MSSRPASDLLSELLLGMRLRGAHYQRVQAAPPLALRFDKAARSARFHFVAAGEVLLCLDDGTAHRLPTGAAAFLPHGRAHTLRSPGEPACSCRDISSFQSAPLCDQVSAVDTRRHLQGPADTILFTGCLEFELGSMQGLVPLMPEAMLVGSVSDHHPELLPILSALEREACQQRAGYAGIMARLADVVATTIVRGWIECGGDGAEGLVAALREPRLSRAILALHRDPGRNWSLAELARESHSSRSVFAERFRTVLGITPLRYAAELRMQLATRWLSAERVPIDVLAERLGYTSQAAFSRAFKRITGASPTSGRPGAGATNTQR